MTKDARRGRRSPTEDQKRQAAEYYRLGMPTLADSVLRPHRHRVTRPAWQKRILRVVSPAWRRKERRVAEFSRLVELAMRPTEHEQAEVSEPLAREDG